MTYTAKPERTALAMMSVLTLFLSWQYVGTFWMMTILSAVAIVQLLCIVLSYEVTIHAHAIHYHVKWFHWTVYEKTVTPASVRVVRFTRTGWQSSLAVIHHAGIPLRISKFTPHTVYEHVAVFCSEHDIATTKTKDYELVQKIHARK